MLARLHMGLGLAGLFKGEHLVHHGFQSALREMTNRFQEAPAGPHSGAKEGYVAGEKAAQINLNFTARGGPAGRQATILCQTEKTFSEGRGPHMFHHHVDALLPRDAPRFQEEIFFYVVDDVVGPQGLGFFGFLIGAHGRLWILS